VIKKIFITILLLIFYSYPYFANDQILVIQSARILPYEDAINGFLNIHTFEVKRVVLTEQRSFNLSYEIEKEHHPLILAIGRDALLTVRNTKDIPVIHMMVLDPDSILTRNENMYGISMNVIPEQQLEIYKKSIPDLNNIGLIYNPDNTGYLVSKIVKAAEKTGVKATRAGDVPKVLTDMSDKIGAFWMLPDVTLITPESIELLLITSIEKKIPILTFSNKYVEMGALMSITVDPYDMGKQAGELAIILIGEGFKGEDKTTFARKGVITINRKVAEKLGIKLKYEVD
jgi:putative tryptophan/tyrosine transport system substrate-binding protein